jgi:hypothetical protein
MHSEQGLDDNTALPYTAIMFEFIETPFFAKAVERYLDDDEYAELQAHLNKNPEAGVVVPGSGGVRKLRWAAEGRGKRGGLRIIYFVRLARGHIWMLTIYGKNVTENIPAPILRALKKAIEDEEDD